MTEDVLNPAAQSTALSSHIGEEVKPAASNAKILLTYAMEMGRPLDESTVKTIVETESLLATGGLTVDQEVAFWQAYKAISLAVAPTTISSLRATMDVVPSRTPERTGIWGNIWSKVSSSANAISPARKAVRWYTSWVIVVLLALLFVQIYQLFGVTVISNLRSLTAEYETLTAKSTAALAKGAAGATELEALAASLETLDLRQHAAYGLLTWWSDRLPQWVAPVLETSSSVTVRDDAAAKNIAVFQRALMINEALQRYFLPLLYGLLGSCVYVLRSLAGQIRARSFTESAKTDFRLRIYTGALSGLVVGWFFSSDSGGVLATLSPNALAFLAGYSIDLLFNAMDRIIAAFSGSDTQNQTSKGEPT